MRLEKTAIVKELRGVLEGAEYVFLADYQGLTVEQTTDLRSRLAENHTRFRVVSNSFLKRAAVETGRAGLESMIEGPTAIVVGRGDVAQAAKILKAFIKEKERPVLKGGMLGLQLLSTRDIEDMASLPSREILLGQLVGTVAAPMSQLVGVMKQKISSLLYVLRAAEEKKQTGS